MSADTQTLGRAVNTLLILSTLRSGPRHGYQIALDVEASSGGAFELQHGTLYPILHRLEQDGLIRGEWSGEGARRKEYALTASGRRHLGEEVVRVRDIFQQLLRLADEAFA